MKFLDCIELNPKISFEKGEVYPFIEMANVSTCSREPIYVDEQVYNSGVKFENGDSVVARITPCLQNGKRFYCKNIDRGFGSTEFLVFRPKKNLTENRYLYYLLQTDYIKENMIKSMVGSTGRQRVNNEVFKKLEVSLPPIETQKKIADILSAYDDLIENNQKQIKLLEEAAQRLYKEWFIDLHFPGHESTPIIDGIPQGWEMGTLGEIALFKRGKTITKDQTIYGNIPVVAGGLEPAYYHNQANTVAPVITVSGSGANAGFTRLYSVNVWASDCSYVDSQVTNNIYFVYCCLKDKTAELDALQKGAAQPHVYAKDINVIKLLIPNNDLLKQYNEIVECIFKKIKVLEAQNLQLKEARDRLLPKLMNGEIEVSMDKKETVKIDNFDYIRKHWKAVPYDEDLPLAARSTGDISGETLEKLKEIAEEE